MILSIQHITEYQFDQPVRYALQRLKLRPKDGAGQTIRNWQLLVDGGKVEAEHDDPHNNHVTLILSRKVAPRSPYRARDRSKPPTIMVYWAVTAAMCRFGPIAGRPD